MNSAHSLPSLYKRTATGAVQEWTISYQDDRYWTISGQVDGQKVTHDPVTCTPKNVGKKNESSANEQAELEARAKWQKKSERGYTQSINNIDSAVEHKILPMLAKPYEHHLKKVTFPVACQFKYDGLRCIVTRTGAYSREWKPFATMQYLCDFLKPYFDENPNILAFDGELYSNEYKTNFNTIVSIVKQSKPNQEDLDRAKELMKYHVYDYVDADGSLSFQKRSEVISEMFNEETVLHKDPVIATETFVAKNQKEMDEHFELCLSLGYEGQMIRNLGSTYQHKRTADLLKRKTFQDTEFLITGYKSGKGNREGCLVIECVTRDGKKFESSLTGDVEYQKRAFSVAGSLISKYATIKFQDYTPDGAPRFPTCLKFREAISGAEITI